MPHVSKQLGRGASPLAGKQVIVTKEAAISPVSESGRGSGWYREGALLIEDMSPTGVRDNLEFGARTLSGP